MVSAEVKKENSADDNVFYAAMKDTKYMLYNSKGKRVDKTYYNDVIFDSAYPLFKASTEAYDYIITSEELGKINLTSLKKEYKAYDSHIRLDKYLSIKNGESSRVAIQRWIEEEKALVNGKKAKASYKVDK